MGKYIDKEKLAKVRAEIERRKKLHEKSLTNPIHEGFGLQKVIESKISELTYLLSFVDSMQKEPKECMYSKDNYTNEDRKVICGGCEEDCRFNKKEESVNNGIDLGCGVIWKDEEPASEELEKEIDSYFSKWLQGASDEGCFNPDSQLVSIYDCHRIARHFANWQKHKDESYTKSMYKVGINTGKELMEQQMMAKAVDATVHIDAGGYPYIPQMELYDYDKDIPLAKEGDKYKVILIKGGWL